MQRNDKALMTIKRNQKKEIYMKLNLLLAIFMLLIGFSNSFAQQYSWVDISNNLPASTGTSSLSDLYFINDTEGWICSSALGEIYHTTDGGQTFAIQTTQYSTNAIHMLNSKEGYAGGLNGRVYRTTDGGGTWNLLGSIGGASPFNKLPTILYYRLFLWRCRHDIQYNLYRCNFNVQWSFLKFEGHKFSW
jgi:hypothetical protein